MAIRSGAPKAHGIMNLRGNKRHPRKCKRKKIYRRQKHQRLMFNRTFAVIDRPAENKTTNISKEVNGMIKKLCELIPSIGSASNDQ